MSFAELYWLTVGVAVVAILSALRPRFTAPVVFATAGALLYVQGFHFWDLVVDDAYISFRYSQHFADGDGIVWNAGERVEGYTNFLWVLILAATERAGIGIVTPSRWIGLASTFGTLLVMWLMARRLAPESPRNGDLVFAGAAIVFGALPATGYWATAGLEEPSFTFLALLALYRHVAEEADRQALPLSAVAALAAALMRPEGVLVAAVILAFKVAAVMRSRDGQGAMHAALWLVVFALPFAIYFGWRWSYYGYALPNTYYQKVSGGPMLDFERYRDGLAYVREFWVETGAVLIFPLPLLALMRPERRRVALPLITFTLLWAAYVAYVGGDFMSLHRFMLPVTPTALLLSADALMFLGVRLRGQHRPKLEQAAAVGVSVLIVASLAIVPEREERALLFRQSTRASALEISEYLNQQDESTYIALGAAGYIPYETELRSLDTLGLTDEHIAHGPRLSDTTNAQGHRKGDGAYVISREPDIIIVAARVDIVAQNGEDWRRRRDSGELLALDIDLLNQPDFWRQYEAVWVELRSGIYFNFFRRIGSTKVAATRANPQ